VCPILLLLAISNLSRQTSEGDLQNPFSAFGQVTAITIFDEAR
jgi:hypothetical protein